MTDSRLIDLRLFIADRTGIQFRTTDEDKFAAAIAARMKELRLRDREHYRALLERSDPESRSEWQYLTAHLVPGESYFFRDRGQMDLIETVLLPELILSRRRSGRRSLRIWSAGCSTGEEPYSLAALVYAGLPDWRDWDVSILGTDPNEDALERARIGRYTDWSFRQVPAERRERFFQHESGTWRILPEIQAMVNFRRHDLYTAHYPERDGPIQDLDLIVCRNVFIYLQPMVIATIIEKIQNSLAPDGCLITGHGELSEARPSRLTTRVFPASIVYRRSTAAEVISPAAASPTAPHPGLSNRPTTVPATGATRAPVISSAAASPPATPVDSPRSGRTTEPGSNERSDVPDRARELLTLGQLGQATDELKRHCQKRPEDLEASYLLARIQADLGQHERAAMVLHEILKQDPFGVRGYFLLAQIAEEQGDRIRAMELLKRSIYIDPDYIPGYLELGLLYEREGDGIRSRRMLSSTLDLLKRLTADTEIEEYDGQTAEHLIERVIRSLPP
jgi:chemotaxis protein methyltransferase CheR